MSFTSFKPKRSALTVKDRGDEFRNFKPAARTVAQNPGIKTFAEMLRAEVAPVLKTQARKRQSIRDSARGEECTVRIEGVCSGDPAHTIWSHAPLGAAGKGRGIKAIDVAGAFACVECDAVVDGQRKRPEGMTREQVLLDWFLGHMRSLVKLSQKGLL